MGANDLGSGYWQSKRLSRRKVLAGAAAGSAALGAVALVGCSSSTKKTPAGSTPGAVPTSPPVNDGTQDGIAKPGGILNIRQGTTLPSMNPLAEVLC